MKKYKLSSFGFYIITIVGTSIMFILTLIVFLTNNSIIFYKIVSIICLSFFLFSLYLCLFDKISLKKDCLVVWKFKKIYIPCKDIIKIYTSKNLLENIIYIETNDKTYKISGKSTLLGKKINKRETNKIVQELCKLIKCK